MRSAYLSGFGWGTAIFGIALENIPAAIVAAGFLIAAGLYRIAESKS